MRLWKTLPLLLACGAIAAQAQTATLTLDDAIRIALERGIDVQRAANSVSQGQTGVEQARAAFLPNLSVGVSPGVRFDRNGGSSNTFGTSDQTSSSIGVSLSSSMNLFAGYATEASLAQARQQLTAASSTLVRTREQTAYDAAADFLQILLNRELINTAQENLRNQRAQLDLIQALSNAGAQPVADLYAQQASVASAELQLISADHDYQLSIIRLKQLLQLDPNTDYTFVEPPQSNLAVDTSAPARSRFLDEALAGRADVQAEQARIAATQEGIRIAHAGALPTVGLSASVGSSFSSTNTDGSFASQIFDNNPGLSLGLNFSLPIFDNRRTKSNEELAELQYQNELLTLKSLQQQVALEVQQAYLDYIMAAKQLDVANVQVIAAKQSLDAQQERYRVGVARQTDLSAAQAVYTQAEVSRAQAAYNLILRRRAIDFYHGLLP